MYHDMIFLEAHLLGSFTHFGGLDWSISDNYTPSKKSLLRILCSKYDMRYIRTFFLHYSYMQVQVKCKKQIND
jgi:hypothetical protein